MVQCRPLGFLLCFFVFVLFLFFFVFVVFFFFFFFVVIVVYLTTVHTRHRRHAVRADMRTLPTSTLPLLGHTAICKSKCEPLFFVLGFWRVWVLWSTPSRLS